MQLDDGCSVYEIANESYVQHTILTLHFGCFYMDVEDTPKSSARSQLRATMDSKARFP